MDLIRRGLKWYRTIFRLVGRRGSAAGIDILVRKIEICYRSQKSFYVFFGSAAYRAKAIDLYIGRLRKICSQASGSNPSPISKSALLLYMEKIEGAGQ